MNFVTRNLGWILLLLFFLFMLFVISSNGSKKIEPINTLTGAALELSGTGETNEKLDDLVKMMDNNEEAPESISEDIISDEVSAEDEKKGFFSFMNWGKGKNDLKNISEESLIVENTNPDENSHWGIMSEEEKEEAIKKIEANATHAQDTEKTEKKKGFFSRLFGKKESQENIDVTITASGESIKEDIDSELVMLEEKNEEAVEKVTQVKEEISEEVTDLKKDDVENLEEKMLAEKQEEVQEEKKSLFAKLFGGKSKEEKEQEEKEQEEDTQSETGTVVTEEEVALVADTNITPREELIGLASDENTSSSSQNIKKDTPKEYNIAYANIQKYAPEVLVDSQMYPGANLETAVGQKFEIGVHSLKLNNAYFNETLGYMMRGDVIKQLTPENVHGCFQVEITRSRLSHNVGKTGYVCKKYLTYSSESEPTPVDYDTPVNNTKIEVHTHVGDLISIEKPNVMLGDTILQMGDIIDQMSEADENSCFVAHVYESQSSENLGKIGTVCAANLY